MANIKRKVPSVVIVVPNYNGESIKFRKRSILSECLKSIRKLDYKNYKVVVGDGNSPDRSEEVARRFGVDFFRNRVNLGPIKNNNTTIRYVIRRYNPDYILWFNNDALVTERDFLDKLVEVAESDKLIAIEGCRLLYPDGRIQHAGVTEGFRNRGRFDRDRGEWNMVEDIYAVTAAVCLYRVSALRKIGLFDDTYNTSCEDVDLCMRAKEHGFRVIYNGKVSAIHLEGFTVKSGDRSVKTRDFLFRQEDYMYLSLRYGGIRQRIRGVKILLGRCIFVLEGERDGRSGAVMVFRSGIPNNIILTLKAFAGAYRRYRDLTGNN